MPFPELETSRLNLVEITESHIDRYFEIMSLDNVTKYYGMESLKEAGQALDIIKSFQAGFESMRSMRWGIVLKDNDTFIGTIGLNNLQAGNKKAEIGFEIHPDFWKNGYTFEAAQAILEYAFVDLQLFRIGAITFLENHASSGLLMKMGFSKEGILRGNIRQYGKNHDTFMFSILKPEWEQAMSKTLQAAE